MAPDSNFIGLIFVVNVKFPRATCHTTSAFDRRSPLFNKTRKAPGALDPAVFPPSPRGEVDVCAATPPPQMSSLHPSPCDIMKPL